MVSKCKLEREINKCPFILEHPKGKKNICYGECVGCIFYQTETKKLDYK